MIYTDYLESQNVLHQLNRAHFRSRDIISSQSIHYAFGPLRHSYTCSFLQLLARAWQRGGSILPIISTFCTTDLLLITNNYCWMPQHEETNPASNLAQPCMCVCPCHHVCIRQLHAMCVIGLLIICVRWCTEGTVCTRGRTIVVTSARQVWWINLWAYFDSDG